MDPITQNTPATIAKEAKDRALKLIEQNKDCASYVRPEDLDTAALFVPVVSVIKPTTDDFYPPIPKVGIMMKPQLVNLLKEKAGISLTRTETSKRGDYVYVAHVWGEKRQPDGTMLVEDASYEWDCNVRAELDYLSQPDTYKSEIAKRRHLLELAKFGEQRAVTGAQHSLIHKLAHVARSFKTPEELMRGMIVSRVDRNVNGVLADPGLREAALGQMLGATETVFGPQKQIARTYDVETGERIEPPAATGTPALPGQQPLFEDSFDDAPTAAAETEKTPLQKARELLATYRDAVKPSPKATKLLNDVLENADSTLETINQTVDRIEVWLQGQRGRTA